MGTVLFCLETDRMGTVLFCLETKKDRPHSVLMESARTKIGRFTRFLGSKSGLLNDAFCISAGRCVVGLCD